MLGVIGGSGLYRLEGVRILEEVKLNTPFGEPSSPLLIGDLNGKKLVFLARHGRNHEYPPHLVPYRANLWALKELGVERVLAVSAVGSINRAFIPGDFVIVSDFLDFTKTRKSTFYEGKFSPDVEGQDRPSRLLKEKKVVHVDVSEAYCPEMRSVLEKALGELSLRFHPAGVYACTEGPRF